MCINTEDRILELKQDIKNVLLFLFDKNIVEKIHVKVVPCRAEIYGDYTTNVAMVLSRRVGEPPMEIAKKIIDKMPLQDWMAKIECAKPGFINFYLGAVPYGIIDEILEAQGFWKNDIDYN